jgi:hypothetical protein
MATSLNVSGRHNRVKLLANTDHGRLGAFSGVGVSSDQQFVRG